MAATNRNTATTLDSETASTFFDFLALPPELRGIVYDMLFLSDGPITLLEQRYRDVHFIPAVRIRGRQLYGYPYIYSWWRFLRSKKCDLSIARVNKLLHLEATRRLYTMMHFKAFSPASLPLFFEAIGPRNNACITTICLGIEFLSGDVEGMDEACEALSSLPSLNQLVVGVKFISLEYLHRRAKRLEFEEIWHYLDWISGTKLYVRKLLLFAKLLVGQGVDDNEKRRLFSTLEIQCLNEYQDGRYRRIRAARGEPTDDELAAGLRDDVEKLLVRSGYLAASSNTYDIRPVLLE